MFGLFKSISLVIVGILITGCTFISNISNNDTMSNDDLVNSYDNFLQDISLNGLTKDNKLEGKRKYGIDEYVGTYKANYNSRVVRKLKMWYNLSAGYERRKLESSLYGVTLIHI